MPASTNTHSLSFTARLLSVVSEHADRPAIFENGKQACSFAELHNRASELALQLKTFGIGKEDIVGICLEKSADYITALLAVWYSGAAFLPLDPKQPQDRLLYMLRESAAKAVITRSDLNALFSDLKTELLVPDFSSTKTINDFSIAQIEPENLAYIIFTSGSTGQPKGVMVTHRGIINFIEAQIEAFELTNTSRSLFYLSTVFDASVSDIGTTLLAGAALFIEEPERLQPGPDFASLLAERGITHMDAPPSLLRMLDRQSMPNCLETIIIGGEACPPQVVREWSAQFKLINVYGPTESTVCTSLGICNPITWDKPLIGHPIENITYQIFDENLELVAVDTPGELYIGGIALARGYLNRPDLTTQKFIEKNGERLYKTGDLVVQDKKGDIQFLGRVDRQVKVRGLLIEPEEIETRLCEHPDIQQAAVIKRPLSSSAKREVLVAFIVSEADKHPSGRQLNEHLNRFLPRWMLPQHYETQQVLPRTATGKVDLALLRTAPITRKSSTGGGKEISGTTALLLAEIWKEVLSLDSVSADDDFFDLGGDSFAVIEIAALAEARGLILPPSTVISWRTIGAIATALDKPESNNSAGSGMTAQALRKDIILNEYWQNILKKQRAEKTLPTANPAAILLTGATGFLGSRLLVELLQKSTAEIYCLVRADSVESAFKRIEQALSKQNQKLSPEQIKRILPVCGTLEKPCFGMTESFWLGLSNKIESVFHCAAEVNLVKSYAQLRAGNVGGILEIARFMSSGLIKSLHYASTLSVFVATNQNTGVALESDHLQNTEFIYGGYAQSKWAAEVLLRLLEPSIGPVSYYRFGLITGDTKTGIGPDNDLLALLVRGLSSVGIVPKIETNLAMDISPVDYCAAAMAELALSGTRKNRYDTFHIANEKSLSFSDLVENMRDYGLDLKEVDTDEYLAFMKERAGNYTAESAACLALCRGLTKGSSFEQLRTMDLFQATDIAFDTKNTANELRETGLFCPDISGKLIQTYLGCMLKDN